MRPPHKTQQGTQIVRQMAILCMALLAIQAISLLLTGGVVETFTQGRASIGLWITLGTMLAAFSTTIVGAFLSLFYRDYVLAAAMALSGVLALVAGVELSQAAQPWNPTYRFSAQAALQAITTFTVAFSLARSLNITSSLRTSAPWVAASTIACIWGYGIASSSWRPLETTEPWLFLGRDIAILATPCALLLSLAARQILRIDPQSLWQSIKLRLPHSGKNKILLWYLAALLAGACLDGVYQLLLFASAHQSAPIPAALFLTIWTGSAWFIFTYVNEHLSNQQRSALASRLADKQATRFWYRHQRNRNAWAATVGLRTATFTIDHDPGSSLYSKLPASLLHIRAEEIERCVTNVLAQCRLHTHTMGPRMFGTLDPEESHRPCVDTLRMFACLYLDASPLVERRIKGLTALLPIVDPSLAKLLNLTEIGHMIRRNQWFFHFDFDWIDQHVIHTPANTRYDVVVSTLSTSIRQAMMEKIAGRGSIGNFVWMGPQARERLIQEAPVLKSIIEPCPIKLEHDGGERLMFIIKFEQLIPRLQRYFNLDSWRRTLMDFEPSAENERIANLLNRQVEASRSPESVTQLLDAVASISWRGFREKDKALQLVLKAYNQINDDLGTQDKLHEVKDPAYRKLHQKMLDTVQRIGYPSQILHDAQITKRSLRELGNLIHVASRPKDPRFVEAWLLLSSADFQRLSLKDQEQLLSFLRAACARNDIWHQKTVIYKAIDSLANIGRHCDGSLWPDLVETCNQMTLRLLSLRPAPDAVCQLMDMVTYLNDSGAQPLALSEKAHHALQHYSHALQDERGTHDADVVAITSRWQLLLGHKEAAA